MDKESDFIDNTIKACFGTNNNRAITKNIKEGDWVQVLHTSGEPEGNGLIIRVNPISLSYVVQMSGKPRDEVVIRSMDQVKPL